MLKKIPCVIFRGGTSRGLFFQEEFLPPPGIERDRILLAVMGSPDIRQIDGLGGAVSTTSKAAIISRSQRDDADVDFTFAQVSIDKPLVDYRGNCGNISSAVGPYAVEMGLVVGADPETLVRVYNTNTKKVLFAYVPTPGGMVSYDGDFAISGVPGTSAKIKLGFKSPAGAVTGRLLPTGNVRDELEVDGLGSFDVSIVDVTNPLVFVRAVDVGMTGKELPDEIDGNPETLNMLEAIRGKAAEKLGFVSDWRLAATHSPAVPKMTIVAEADSFKTANGENIVGSSIDLLGRMMSMQRTHKTYALTGALCTAGAAVLSGSVVNEVISSNFDPQNVRIGHPGGVIQTGVESKEDKNGNVTILWAFGYRTARLIMNGMAFYK